MNDFKIEEISEAEVMSNETDTESGAVVYNNNSQEEVMTNSPEHFEQVEDGLAKCPSCGKMSLKIEGGCHSCVNEECGFSKCDV